MVLILVSVYVFAVSCVKVVSFTMSSRRQGSSLSDGDLFASAFGTDVTPVESRDVFSRMNRGGSRRQARRDRTLSSASSKQASGLGSAEGTAYRVERKVSLEFLPNRCGGRENSDGDEKVSKDGDSPYEEACEDFEEESNANVIGTKMIEVRASPLMVALAKLQQVFPELHSGVSVGVVTDYVLSSSASEYSERSILTALEIHLCSLVKYTFHITPCEIPINFTNFA